MAKVYQTWGGIASDNCESSVVHSCCSAGPAGSIDWRFFVIRDFVITALFILL